MKNYPLRINEKNYELAKKLVSEKGISFNEYINELVVRDLTDDLWEDVESRINRKIDLLTNVLEEQTKEYINNKATLQAMIEITQEVLNVEVMDDEETY